MEFFTNFPVMERVALLELKKGIDLSFRLFSRKYGDAIEAFFDPLLYFLVWLEKLLLSTPWPIIILVIGILAWFGSRSWKLVVGSALAFILIGYFGMWNDCMATVAIITVCTIICIAVGIPVGVVINNFSNHTKKNNNGSKKFSIASPYFRENNLKLKSIPFLSSIRETRSITGN